MISSNSPTNFLSFWRVCATTLVAICVLYVSIVPIGGNDFWLQAKIGELIVHEHAIPASLLFPFTEISAAKFNAHEWLASVAFHFFLDFLGEDLLPLVNGLFGLILFALMTRLAYLRGEYNYAVAIICGLMAMLAENYRHELRPELLSLLLMAAFWNILEDFRSRPNVSKTLLMMLTMIFWVNCHGSFLLGLILVALYSFGHYLDDIRNTNFTFVHPSQLTSRLIMLAVAILTCCLINPYGWELIRFVFSFSSDVDSATHLTEWIPTLDHRLYSLRGFWFALIVWLTLSIVLLVNIRHAATTDILVYVAFSVLAVKAIRFPVYLGMVFAYIGPPYLKSLIFSYARVIRSLQVVCISALCIICVAALYGNAARRRPYYYDDPTKLTQKMISAISDPLVRGNVLNSMELGAELVYRAYPRLKPAIDSRLDSYGTKYVNYIYSLLKDDASFNAFVTRHDVRYVLIDGGKYNDFISLKSWKEGRWRIYCMDHKAVLFQRSDISIESH